MATATATTTRRTRRIRCTAGENHQGIEIQGCNELFSREQLTAGLCSTCRALEQRTDADGNVFLARTDETYIDEQEQGWINGVAADAARRTECTRCQQLAETDEMTNGVCPVCVMTAGDPETDSEDATREATCQRFPECPSPACTDDDPYSGHSTAALAALEATYPADSEGDEGGVPVVVAREIRCRACSQWTSVTDLIDGICASCLEAQRERLAEQTRQIQEQATQQVQEVQEETPTEEEPAETPAETPAPRTRRARASRMPNEWDVFIEYAGGRVTVHRERLEFDLAQQVARDLAKSWARETGEKSSWMDVKTWLCAGAIISIDRSRQPEQPAN